MQSKAGWPRAETIETGRLTLEPLSLDHAETMWPVLRDRALYSYTGDEPPSVNELYARYERQVVGRSPDGSQTWLNWIVRERQTESVVGTVQATLRDEPQGLVAELAWIIGVEHQGRGYATQAAGAMVDWLRSHEIKAFVAHIHPDHGASERVAARIGLIKTDAIREGEIRWASANRGL